MSFERIEPGTSEWTAFVANHEQRYSFAADYLHRAGVTGRVLDVATGVGYGARLLADRVHVPVTAIDRDERALEIARRRFAHGQVDFRRDDCETLCTLSGDGPFAAAVSLETIEHLPDAARFLQRLRNVLGPGAALVVSTPNRMVSAADRWDYHEREYSATELMNLLDDNGFSMIRLFGQQFTAIGRLRQAVRGEINCLRFNPMARFGFWLQRRLRGFRLPLALPECPEDFEIVPYESALECEATGAGGPFVIIAIASAPVP